MRTFLPFRVAPLLPVLILLPLPAARAESMKGVVTELDPAARSIALFRNDTSEEPRRLELRLAPDAKLNGVSSIGELRKGSEVRVQVKPGDLEKLEAEYLELVGSSEETLLNLRSASLKGSPAADGPRRRPNEPAARRRETAPSGFSDPATDPGTGLSARRPPEPRDTETDWYLSNVERVRPLAQYRPEQD